MSSYCPDCGPMGVSHAAERWTARTDLILRYFGRPMDALWEMLRPAVAYLRPGRLAPPLLHLCAAIKLGRIVEKADDKDTGHSTVLWTEAERRGIIMREFRPFNLPRDIFFATWGNDTRFFDGLPRPRLAHESAQIWMDDKGIVLKKFGQAGIPVPRGRSCTTITEAERAFRDIHGPVVVKPSIGSRSRHTYMHITEMDALRQAFLKARELSDRVVVEEEIPGFVFRVTLVGGKIAGVMRREPPHVTGDGKRTVRELVEAENKNPLRRGPIFHQLELGKEALAALKEKDLSLTSVPTQGSMVFLHSKMSREYGASTTEITDVHPENVKLFLRIAEVMDDPLVGVDIIMEDAGRSWHDQKCGVIECNSLPDINLHHYPLKGPARNVAGMVWDMIFPDSGIKG